MTDSHPHWMAQALALAELGRGWTSPNPIVGAIVVKDGVAVGRGWHREFGGPHAEVFALKEAGEAARGARLYCTLEPCSHFGKTPPCTLAVIDAGIKTVILGARDPHPQAAGGAAACARRASKSSKISERMNAGAATRLSLNSPPQVCPSWR